MVGSDTAGGRATIYDIAKMAGVNPSTVSRALGHQPGVSVETRKLVEDAAAQLSFRVNPLAREVPTGRTGTVGLIVADITNPSYFDIIRGAQSAAAARGLTLVLAESSESGSTESVVAQRIQPSTDGLILASPRMSDPGIRELNKAKPVVVINRSVDGIESVVPDIEPGIGDAVRHLAANGHTRFAFLTGPEQSWISARRWDSFRAACEWAGRTAQPIPTVAPTQEGGRRAAREVLATGATAALCYNDLLAIGLMRELQAAGVKVPDEFSVVGFDNIFGADFTTPTLTSIASPFKECGATALERLLSLRQGAEGSLRDVSTPLRDSPLRTTLIVRGSSGRLLAPAT